MGKKEDEAKAQQEEELRRMRVPRRNDLEMFGIVTQRLGGNQIRIMCEDGKERVCRIPGKLLRRVWMRVDDIVIVKLWDFQPSKADVVWRYLGMQVEYLRRKGYLGKLPV